MDIVITSPNNKNRIQRRIYNIQNYIEYIVPLSSESFKSHFR